MVKVYNVQSARFTAGWSDVSSLPTTLPAIVSEQDAFNASHEIYSFVQTTDDLQVIHKVR